MAELAGVFASSHAPLVVRGWKDIAAANQQSLFIDVVGAEGVIHQDHRIADSLANRPADCYVLSDV